MPKCPSKACVCAVVTIWIAISTLVLIIMGVTYIIPYLRILRYHQTWCKVETKFYTSQFVCSCGYWCESLYPCIIVHVSINTTDHMWIVALYEDDIQQRWVIETDTDKQEMCALYICERDKHYNRMMVERFAVDYGSTGTLLPCFYDPNNPGNGAVLHINWPGQEIFHAVFWPAIGIFIGAILCIIFCRHCRKKELEPDETTDVMLTETRNHTAAEQASSFNMQSVQTISKKTKNKG